jgi:hypothetical protein
MKSRRTPIYRHAVLVDPATVFASSIQRPEAWAATHHCSQVDLRLEEGTAALDAGQALPGSSDGYRRQARDLGAYEPGDPLQHYGPQGRNEGSIPFTRYIDYQ